MSSTWWDVASNVFYIGAVIRAFQFKAYAEAVLLMVVVIVSSAYHACRTWSFCFGLPFNFLQHLDVFVALSVFVLVGIYLMAFSKSEFKAIAYLIGFIIVYSVVYLASTVLEITLIVSFLIGTFLLRICFSPNSYPYAEVDGVDLAAAAVCGIVGGMLFIFWNEEPTVHGWWHLLTALAAYFSIESLQTEWSLFFWHRNPKPKPDSEPIPISTQAYKPNTLAQAWEQCRRAKMYQGGP